MLLFCQSSNINICWLFGICGICTGETEELTWTDEFERAGKRWKVRFWNCFPASHWMKYRWNSCAKRQMWIDLTKAAAKDDTREDLIQAVCRAVQYFQDNDQYFLLLFSQPTKARFEELLYMHYLKHYNLEQMELKQRYYFLQRVVGGFCIIRAWMAEGYPISAEELSHFLVQSYVG